jgi:hypothetical protein
MPNTFGAGLRRSMWTCALALALVPGLASAAPPDEGPPVGDAPPVDDTVAPIDPLAPIDIPPTPEREPPPIEPLPPVEASAPPVEASAPPGEPPPQEPPAKHGKDSIKLPNPKIPPTGTTQMWFRSTSFVDYFGNNYDSQDNNDKFFAFVNYLNFGSDSRLKKNWQVSTMARVDTHNVFNAKSQPLCDSSGDGVVSEIEATQCNFGGDYRIERIQLRVSNKHFEVTAGDFNVNFGRGIALSIRKIADIGFDATVKGGRVDIMTKYIDVTGIAGVTNRQQTDFATRNLFFDPGYPHALCERTPGLTKNKYGNPWYTMCSDVVSGARFDANLPGKVKLGGHYVFWWFGQLAGDQHEGMHQVGGDLTRARIGKHWDLFGGVTGLMRNPQHQQYYPGLVENGLAAYLSNSLTFGNTFALLEGKYYNNYTIAKNNAATTIQYAEAPTLELPGQIIPAASNTSGGRLLLEHTLRKSRVTLFGNYLGYVYALLNDENMFDPNVGHMMHHGYVGLRWRDGERGSEVQALGGYRWEGLQRPPDEDTKAYGRKLPHAEFYVNQIVGKTRGHAHSVSLRAEWRHERIQKGGAPPKHFHKGNIILGYGLTPFFTFSFIGGYSSEFPGLPGEPELHDQPCDNASSCDRKPHLWPGAELRVNFFESSFLRVFAGRQVGGLLCVNGSCRNLPDFEGMRLDLVLSF